MAFNYGFGKNRTVEVCNSVCDQLVYIAIENAPQLARNTPNCLNCCSGFRVNSQVGYISIKLISHYISLHMLKPSVLDI